MRVMHDVYLLTDFPLQLLTTLFLIVLFKFFYLVVQLPLPVLPWDRSV